MVMLWSEAEPELDSRLPCSQSVVFLVSHRVEYTEQHNLESQASKANTAHRHRFRTGRWLCLSWGQLGAATTQRHKQWATPIFDGK